MSCSSGSLDIWLFAPGVAHAYPLFIIMDMYYIFCLVSCPLMSARESAYNLSDSPTAIYAYLSTSRIYTPHTHNYCLQFSKMVLNTSKQCKEKAMRRMARHGRGDKESSKLQRTRDKTPERQDEEKKSLKSPRVSPRLPKGEGRLSSITMKNVHMHVWC